MATAAGTLEAEGKSITGKSKGTIALTKRLCSRLVELLDLDLSGDLDVDELAGEVFAMASFEDNAMAGLVGTLADLVIFAKTKPSKRLKEPELCKWFVEKKLDEKALGTLLKAVEFASKNPTEGKEGCLMRLTVRFLTGGKVKIAVSAKATLGSLKQAIQKETGIAKDRQLLFSGKTMLGDGEGDSKLLSTLQVKPGSELSLVVKVTRKKILVRTIMGEEYTFDYDPNMTRRQLKEKISDVGGYDPNSQRLIWHGRQGWLSDTMTLGKFYETYLSDKHDVFKKSDEEGTAQITVIFLVLRLLRLSKK
eukprot:CAMPEP_0114507882 /NCGR_PEP_ID=MMETSP0109-20121206/12270_1 /TAXON_ID=29199 /ORGANISM="Chlorarachnion reptans, Strain CCCM449" /LENGTH=306 /DNA_ID=CAMNT_0001686711 /DNA_START=135 /DNA_END=1055 /DNA_ORIENTATION=-